MDLLKKVQEDNMKKEVTPFEVGDTVRVHVRVIEGKRERIQMFEGVVLKKQHGGINESFTVRKLSSGIGVERTFPVHSPKVAQIDVVRRGKVRRAKIALEKLQELKAETNTLNHKGPLWALVLYAIF